MNYGSVCSGIEAASVAWHPLGWKPAWFAEIEPFPSAVLAHHWPEVPNLGDFTAIRHSIAAGELEAPDVLVGGTPCQAFSIAGLRQSLDDKRGQLTIEFVRLADAIDSARSFRGQRPVTVVWENVPGVLTTPDNAFGCFLAGLVGEDDPLEPPGGRWTNAGYVRGPRRAVAWRTLDAQYFGVAQRRRRVFVVASAGGICPEQVLFEFDGVRRDSAPSREAGKGFAPVAGKLTANGGGTTRPAGNCNEPDFCVPLMSSGCENSNWGGIGLPNDPSFTLDTTQAHSVAYAIQERAIHPNLNAGPGGSHWDGGPHPSLNQSNNIGGVGMSNQEIFSQRGAYLAPHPVNVISPLVKARDGKGFDASEDGTGRGCGAVAIALRGREGGAAIEVGDEAGFTLRASQGGGDKPHVMVPVAFQSKQSASAQAPSFDSISPTLDVAKAGGMAALVGMQVRRLTPTEAERLQGFPDRHTKIPWRGKPADECPDGPRYKALGNSMAVPVMRWIGERVALHAPARSA